MIKDLSAIFSPILTANMNDEQLSAIASESEDIRHERATLKQKLSVLESGKQVLYEHIGKNSEPTTYVTRSDVSNQQCGLLLGQLASQLLPISVSARHPVVLTHQTHGKMSGKGWAPSQSLRTN